MSLRQPAADPPPLRQAVAELVALSDERDTWLRRLEAEYGAGFDLGYAIGIEAGRAQVLAEEARFRRETARMVRTGDQRSHDQMDRKRYPPDGRVSWLLPGNGGAA